MSGGGAQNDLNRRQVVQPSRIVSMEILNIIEFTSSRKRMSVIVKDPEG